MIYHLVRNGIKTQYAGSILGWGWAVAQPILLLTMYIFVYIVVLRVRLPELSTFAYILTIFSGLVPWLGLNQSIVRASGSLISNRALLKNTAFPIDLVPVQAVLVNIVNQLVAMFLLGVLLVFNGKLSVVWSFVVIAFVAQLLFSFGLAWVIAMVTLIVRDMQEILGILFLFLMFVSPIGYTLDMIPDQFRIFAYLNPLTYMIEMYRKPLIDGVMPSLATILIFSILSLLTFWGGYSLYKRARYFIADVL